MKKLFQKLFLAACLGLTSVCSLSVFAGPPPVPTTTDFQHQNTTALPGVPKANEGAAENEDLFGGDSADTTKNLLAAIKNAINRVLGLLALIALIILIIQGIQMLINAKDSKKIDEGYTTVKNVAIALIFIGVSWLVVSFIFRVIGFFTNTV